MVYGNKIKAAIFIFCVFFVFLAAKYAVASVPRAFSYQGRLYDSENNLLGGTGTAFYFRFSIWDNEEVGLGSKLWPQGTPSITSSTVEYGVFNVLIGDDTDPLTLDFDNGDYYLQIEVASESNFLDGETLGPRQKIVASGYAINSDTVGSYHANESATGTAIPVLTDGNLILGDANPEINATEGNILTFQGSGATGDIEFFNSANKITNTGNLLLSGQMRVGSFSSAPSSTGSGALYFNSLDNNLYLWTGSEWEDMTSGGSGHWVLDGETIRLATSTYDVSIGTSESGALGIGTDNPSGKLEVAGGYETSGLDIGGFGLHFASGGTAPDHSQIWWGDGTGWKLNFGTKDAEDNFVSKITFTDSGNVGIGTNNPFKKLHVLANGGSFLLEGEDHAYMEWYPQGVSEGRKAYAGFAYASSSDLAIVNESDSGDIILFPVDGSVGIGTDNPSGKLEVVGGYQTSGLDAGGFGLHFASGGTAPDHSQIWWGDGTGWKLNFGTKDAEDNFVPRLTIIDTGYIGVGTSTPEKFFDVNGEAIIRGDFDVFGDSFFVPTTDSTSTLKISNASSTEAVFLVDTENNRVKIGDSGQAGDFTTAFVLDTKSDAGDPVGINGAMYYNESANKFRCYENDAWKDCDTTGASGSEKTFRSFSLLRDADGVKMRNASSGGDELENNISRKKIDLTDFTNVRAQFAHSLNNRSQIQLRIDFSTDNCATWNGIPLVSAYGASVLGDTNQTSAFSAIPPAAKTDVCVRAVIIGNNRLDPIIRYVDIDVE